MTRRQVAVLAGRIVALWLMASGLGAAASFLVIFASVPPESRQAYISTALMFGGLPLASGLTLWSFSEPLALRMFREQPGDKTPTSHDLYRVASAFVGLLLVGGAIPRVALWLSLLALSFQTRSTVLGPVGLQAEQRAILFGIQTQAAAVSTAVELGLGLALLISPHRIARFIASLRREPIADEADQAEEADEWAE